LPANLGTYGDVARSRLFPEMDVRGWTDFVLASELRAWVPLVDSHSNWAPLEEEATVYDVDLDDLAKSRLWSKATPTLVGARLDDEPLAPLHKEDVVLRVGTVDLAGMSAEQLDQASVAAFELEDVAKVTVLRGDAIVSLDVPAKARPGGDAAGDGGSPSAASAASSISVDRVRAVEGEIAVITIHDIHDGLGADLGRAIVDLKKDPKVQALALDLRGNGGGSMDGAIDALGHFLPGLPMFPLRAAQGESVLPDVAPKPPPEAQWAGPVVSLVDGDTASAAEMLAGALNAYGRGVIVGTRTFGKGCVQEYIDDDAKVGILRLTTLLYALPDGKPVQRVGLPPNVAFPFSTGSKESESKTPHVGPTWAGPDVRPKPLSTYPSWPKLQGPFGPCKDPALCSALESIGKPRRVGRK
jgi:carboxyl-terminal processing protease